MIGLRQLFEESQKLDYSQSNGMVCVDKMKGPGFFPGCTGTIANRQNISGLSIMVLGQDFDTEANHILIDENKGEIEKNTTWRNLKILLKDLNIDNSDCFFTNAYIGLRPSSQAGTKNTGQSPAAKRGAEGFAKECYAFFKKQLSVVKPELVLVLGKETAKFLSKAFPAEFKKWADIKTLKAFYEKEDNVVNVLEFEGKKIKFLFVIHPSLNNTNRSIIWGKEEGKMKEQKMLKKYI